MKTAIKVSTIVVAILAMNCAASSNSPIGNIKDELVHPDGLVAFKAASFQLIANECFEYFAEKGVELNTFWWNVRYTGNSWRVIVVGRELEESWRMCRVTLGSDKSDSTHTVVELPE